MQAHRMLWHGMRDVARVSALSCCAASNRVAGVASSGIGVVLLRRRISDAAFDAGSSVGFGEFCGREVAGLSRLAWDGLGELGVALLLPVLEMCDGFCNE